MYSVYLQSLKLVLLRFKDPWDDTGWACCCVVFLSSNCIIQIFLLLSSLFFYIGPIQCTKYFTRHFIMWYWLIYLPILCSYSHLIDEDTEVQRNGSHRWRLHINWMTMVRYWSRPVFFSKVHGLSTKPDCRVDPGKKHTHTLMVTILF